MSGRWTISLGKTRAHKEHKITLLYVTSNHLVEKIAVAKGKDPVISQGKS